MSAFLGPIHTWLYNKVLFQNDLAEHIAKVAADKNWNDVSFNINRYGVLPEGELADIVDETNIHGWLQDKVSLVENKLAYIVTVLTDEYAERITDISDAVYTYGKAHAYDGNLNAKEAFQYLETILLNGMPCDRVNQIVSEDENQVSWKETVNIHKSYWDQVHGNMEYFDAIRESLITGVLEYSGLAFQVTDGVYQISIEK